MENAKTYARPLNNKKAIAPQNRHAGLKKAKFIIALIISYVIDWFGKTDAYN